MKNIFLHIGQPKTGTKSIQHTFLDLKKNGMLETYNFDFYYLLEDTYFLRSEKTAYSEKYINLLMEKILSCIENTKAQNIIFSSELLFSQVILKDEIFIKIFAKTLSAYNVKILLYVRRQDTQYESVWAEVCKRFQASLYPSFPRIYIRQLIALYEKYFTKKNIAIRVYEKKFLYRQDSVCDFLEWLNLQELIPQRDAIRRPINISLSPVNLRISLSFMRQNTLSEDEKKKRLETVLQEFAVNQKTPTFTQVQNLCILNSGINAELSFTDTLLELYKLEKNTDSRSHAYLPLEERKKFLEECREDNAYIAREYLGKEDGILFDETLPQETVSLESPSTDDLVKSFLPMFVHLKQSVDSLTCDNAAMKEQLKKLEEENKKLAVKIEKYTDV